ncbi:hypothetical protein Bpfe_021817 [Biomphalaria pfeifferi]|uniref:Uncharacterized protein n=1 Tax=Biomphalaria pfeifferi TaxID=112525 RepID=A0AAD8F2Y8_BIOPF|nr:hypothetical protein Bpfe_021817 [Biomphalaria pfeifferi]
MRPSPTSLYGLIIQAPLMSHFIASYTRAGVFGCLKADLSSSPHIPVEGVSPPRGILIIITPVPAYSQGTSNWLQLNEASTYPTPKENLE